MRKLLAALLAVSMLFSLAACGSSTASGEKTGAFTAGTYTASAKGMGGDVTVEVVVTADKIESVTVTKQNETAGVADGALDKMPAAIVEAQGLKIDAVSGATVTSTAILAAVTDCLTQAGGDIEALKEKGLDGTVLSNETLEADVVVIGSGMAGLSAAVTAAQAGAKVILLEKMGSVGGASITCGGEILAAGTDAQKAQGIEDTPAALAKKFIDAGEGHVNEEMLTFIANHSADTVEWLKTQGVAFGKVTFSYNDPTQSPLRNHKTADGSGAGFILPLKEAAEKAGVEIRLETKAVSLINEGGVIKGVVAENGGRTVTVMAPSTILATGGFANNAELVAEYCPNLGTSGTFLGETHNGDGLIMARDAGAKIVAGGGAIANPMDLGPTYFADPAGIFLNVTPAGKRFADETEYWFTRSAKLYFEEGYNYYYSIFDSKTQNDKLEDAIAAGTIFKADTIAELAAKVQMDSAVLTATVDRYNTMCAAGKDTDFGKSASGPKGVTVEVLQENVPFLTAIDTAPFYALKVPTTGLTGTFGGPAVTIDGEVLSTVGTVIPGLYAAGEVANGELLYHQYPCSGTSIQICTTMGRQAGAAAAKAAIN